MKYECQLPAEYNEIHSEAHHSPISPSLARHEEFLLGFVPTDDLEDDIATFLIGIGQEQMLVFSRQHGLPVRELAESIRHNHHAELANLKQGKRPLWAGKYQRWSATQKSYYANLLAMECDLLDTMLKQDSEGEI